MSKRFAIVVSAILTLALLLSACGETATPESTVTPTPTPQPTTAPATAEAQTPAVAPTEVEPASCQVYPLTVPVRPPDDTDYVKGVNPDEATVTIIEYADFQCPACSAMAPIEREFLNAHPEVRLVYRHFPLSFHEHAGVTAAAAEAAGAQGRFWEMHDLLYARVSEWNALTAEEARAKMTDYATELGLDVTRFDAEIDGGVYTEKIDRHLAEASQLGLPGTPSYIFDGLVYPADQMGISYQGLEAFLPIAANLLALQPRQYTDLPPLVLDTTKQYEITVKTSQGEVVFDLDTTGAPTQVNSFLFLAQEGWYDDSEFFFVVDDFAAVTGDPSNTGSGSPGYYCIGENVGTFGEAGLVGLVPNGQFFFTLGAGASQLDGAYPVIGRITKGLEVLDNLRRSDSTDTTIPIDRVETVEISVK